MYNQQYTKSEKALKRIETIERGQMDQIEDSSDSDNQENEQQQDNKFKKGVYPNLNDNEDKIAMPKINIDREKLFNENMKTQIEKEGKGFFKNK